MRHPILYCLALGAAFGAAATCLRFAAWAIGIQHIPVVDEVFTYHAGVVGWLYVWGDNPGPLTGVTLFAMALGFNFAIWSVVGLVIGGLVSIIQWSGFASR
jgi:hypothetical protein